MSLIPQLRPRVDSLYIGPDPPPPIYPPPIYMPPAPYNITTQRPGRWRPPILTPIVEGPPPPVEVKRRGQRICTACGKSLRKAAFSKKQWSLRKSKARTVSRRCNACILAGRDASVAVKAALCVTRKAAYLAASWEVKAALLKAAYPAADVG